MIITICGSYRFEILMKDAYTMLSEEGHIVLCPVGKDARMDINALHELHDSKIRMSDAIYVVDYDGYYDEDTKREIDYVKSLGKKILYYSKGD